MSVVFRGIEGGGDEVTEFAFVTDKIFGSVFPIPFVVCVIRWWFWTAAILVDGGFEVLPKFLSSLCDFSFA